MDLHIDALGAHGSSVRYVITLSAGESCHTAKVYGDVKASLALALARRPPRWTENCKIEPRAKSLGLTGATSRSSRKPSSAIVL